MRQIHTNDRTVYRFIYTIAFSLVLASTTLAQPPAGYEALFIGHSFFRPVAAGLEMHPAQAGIVGHSQTVISAGGCNGAPLSLWNNPVKSAEIKAVLDSGNVGLFGMTYHDCAPTTEGYENWFDYALSKNPDTVFFVALPWPGFPEQDYADAAEYASVWEGAYEPEWLPFIDSLRALYPDVEIYSIPYGQAAVELYKLYEAGDLPDVSSLTGDYNDAVFTDTKGHAGRILIDTCELIWLNAIYGVHLDTYDHDPGYITNIKAIARDIMDAHNPDYNGPHRRPDPNSFWDYTDVPYGPETRQWMNIALPDTTEPSGIYFWAHANGGTPYSLSRASADAMLNNGFAVVSWGSLGQLGDEEGLQTAWSDAQVVFDFVRANGAIWNMDPDKIIIGGRSRGSIVSWKLAHSAHSAIKGIYMYNALPQIVWQNGNDSWVYDVTENSPPTYLVYGPPWGDEDGHRPDNVLPIQDRYEALGIGDRFTLYQDMWGDFQNLEGQWINQYRESHYFPELTAVLYATRPMGRKILDGVVVSGSLSDLHASEDQRMEIEPSPTSNLRKQKVDLILAGNSDTTSPNSLSLRFETRLNGGSEGPVIQQVYLIRAGTNRKELVDSRPVSNFEGQIEITPQGDPSRFVNPANGDVTARIVYLTDPGGPLFLWSVELDEVVWFID